MTAVELIERKRDGGQLAAREIEWLIDSYTSGHVADYQMSAMLMAIYLNGMNAAELAAWTDAMLHSGEVLDLSAIPAAKVDKHSTGGVGDKVSIPLAPMVAACGAAVPMMSGRGLGHTGGTLDKLETIPGFRTVLDPVEFHAILARHGLVLAGQSATLVPADRRLYALRDVTGTVPAIPLIASSIMSKKLAEDIDGLVLDVKVGKGAFMADEQAARLLARTMVGIGGTHRTPVVALLTDMNQPLGRQVGNANELAESIDVLTGGGPDDLLEVTYRLGAEMLELAGVATGDEAVGLLEAAVSDGRALAKLADVVSAQGGDPSVLEDPGLLPRPPEIHELAAARAGYVTGCDARRIGIAAVRLGAGRARKEDDVDPRVGISLLAKEGDRVESGQPLARIGWATEDGLAAALAALEEAWEIGDEPPAPRPLIVGTVR